MPVNVTRIGTRLLCTLAALAGAVALAVAIGGCGSSAVTLDPVAQAAEATSAAGGVHMRLTMQVSAPGLPSPVAVSGQGFFNYKTREGSISLDMTGLPTSAATGLPGGALHVEELMKGSTIYVGSPLLAGKLPNGARWMKIDLEQVGGALGLNLQSLTSGESNPAQFLEYLRAHGGSVSAVGSAVVQGVHTTQYHGAIDLEKLAQSMSGAERNQAQQAIEKLGAQTGLQSIPFDVWIDDHHLVRRMTMTFSVDAGGQRAQTQMTIDLSGFGPTPSITAPPDSEVYDGTQAALSGLGSGGPGTSG